MPYDEGYSGATRTVRSVIRMLAGRDHETLVVSRKSFDKEGEPPGHSPPTLSNTLTLDEGVKVYAIPYEVNFEKALYYVIGQWKPDCVLIGEDPTYLSLAWLSTRLLKE
jgi:hypothetical protein